MHATGIPGHIALIRATKELQRTTEIVGAKIDNLAPLVERIGKMLEDRAAASGIVTQHGLEELLSRTISSALVGAGLAHGGAAASSAEAADANVSQHSIGVRGPVTLMHQWGGGLHRVP
jgi:hypothetical protein